MGIALSTHPASTARELTRSVGTLSHVVVDKHSINSCLYAQPYRFRHDDGIPPAWYLVGPPPASARPAAREAVSQAASTDLPSLFPWQIRALEGWDAAGRRGIVEAVTGAGKTRLALGAIETTLRGGGRALALVPTRELQQQWLDEIDEHLIGSMRLPVRVGSFGNGGYDSLQTCEILVATVQSASRYELVPPSQSLLVADEVHHYGASEWSKSLDPGFNRRLGLTATYQRDDGGLEAFLAPYFGPFVYRLGYVEALGDGVISHFKVAFVGVSFNSRETDEYRELDERARGKRRKLIADYGLDAEPFGTFMAQVQRLSKSEREGARQAGLYLSAFSKRRKLLAGAESKFERLRDLAPAVEAADATIVFAQTVAAAERAIDTLADAGISGDSLHAALDPSERKETFDAFRDGRHKVIAAPKLLDEGVDVPESDLAVVLASSRSRRQMIQRMGRVIRRKRDSRLARLVVMYVEGTSEDPTEGAHEDFIGVVTDAADDVKVFESDAPGSAIVDYLNDWSAR